MNHDLRTMNLAHRTGSSHTSNDLTVDCAKAKANGNRETSVSAKASTAHPSVQQKLVSPSTILPTEPCPRPYPGRVVPHEHVARVQRREDPWLQPQHGLTERAPSSPSASASAYQDSKSRVSDGMPTSVGCRSTDLTLSDRAVSFFCIARSHITGHSSISFTLGGLLSTSQSILP